MVSSVGQNAPLINPPVRRRRSWTNIVPAIATGCSVMALLLVGASFFVDAPLQRYMERALNAQLQGYTVRLAAVDFHPLGFSITLEDLAISQNAHPEPPVAHFPYLHASVNWQALLHGRLVADFLLQQPHFRVDRTQLQHEAAEKVSLKDEGWQRAVEAIYPLKINRFYVEDGDLIYIDDDPKRPLHVSQLNLAAENIRNVHSADRIYPSTVHMDGVIFESGKVRADGQANFLAQPFAAVDADMGLDQVQLNYFKPLLARLNIFITDGALSADGHVEYGPQVESFHLKKLTLHGVQLDYVHSTETAALEKTRSATVGRAVDAVSQAPVAVFRVDELHVADSTVGYVDHSSAPGYRVFVAAGDLLVKNVSNQPAAGPASVVLKGQFMGSGEAIVQAVVTPAKPSPNLDLWVTIEKTQLRAVNDVLRTFGNFDVVAGELAFYSQLTIRDGEIWGYLQPMFKDAQVYSARQDAEKPLLHRLYEALVGTAQTLLQNRRGEVSTVATIWGRASSPETSTWEAAIGLIRNAFSNAMAHGFDPTSDKPDR